MAMYPGAATDDILRGLECAVCQEQFRDPRILPCGHTLCLSPCLELITKTSPKLFCPECRAEHDIPPEGVHKFPKNVAVLRQLQGAAASDENKFCSERCPICGDEDELQKCGHCHVYICYTCATEHITSTKERVRRLALEIMEQADRATRKLSYVEERVVEVINRSASDAVAQIENATQQVFSLIESKAKELKTEVEFRRKEVIDKVSVMTKNNKQAWTDVKDLTTTVNDRMADNVTVSPSKLMAFSARLTAECDKATKMDKDVCVYETNIEVKVDTQSIDEALQKFANLIVSEKDEIDTEFVTLRETLEPSISHTSPEVHSRLNEHIGNIIHKDLFNIKLEFGEEGSLPGQFSNMKILALDNNTDGIVVLDGKNNRVQSFDSNGTLNLSFGSRGSGPDQLDSPVGIVISPQSQMIISDRGNRRIKIHNCDGSLCRIIGRASDAGEIEDPRGLALDNQGDIHICDHTKRCVQVFSQEGHFVKQYVPHGCTEPLHISISESGTVFVADLHNCFVLNDTGQLEHRWTVDGFVSALCAVGDSNVLVSDTNNNKITMYDTEGEQVRVFFLAEIDRLLYRRGLAVDRHGDIYVACSSKILKF